VALGYVKMSSFYKLRHLPVKKSKQERSDVRTVNVGIGHDDNAVIAQLADIEICLSNAGSRAVMMVLFLHFGASCRSGLSPH